MNDTYRRLYDTKIGTTQAARKAAFEAAYAAPEPLPVDTIQRLNKDAKVTRVPEHGLTIVQYDGKLNRKAQKKDNDLTARGRSRNAYGGFFAS